MNFNKEIFSIRKFKSVGTQSAMIGKLAMISGTVLTLATANPQMVSANETTPVVTATQSNPIEVKNDSLNKLIEEHKNDVNFIEGPAVTHDTYKKAVNDLKEQETNAKAVIETINSRKAEIKTIQDSINFKLKELSTKATEKGITVKEGKTVSAKTKEEADKLLDEYVKSVDETIANYEKALADYEAEIAALPAKNAEIKENDRKAQEKYATDKAEFDKNIANLNRLKAELQSLPIIKETDEYILYGEYDTTQTDMKYYKDLVVVNKKNDSESAKWLGWSTFTNQKLFNAKGEEIQPSHLNKKLLNTNPGAQKDRDTTTFHEYKPGDYSIIYNIGETVTGKNINLKAEMIESTIDTQIAKDEMPGFTGATQFTSDGTNFNSILNHGYNAKSKIKYTFIDDQGNPINLFAMSVMTDVDFKQTVRIETPNGYNDYILNEAGLITMYDGAPDTIIGQQADGRGLSAQSDETVKGSYLYILKGSEFFVTFTDNPFVNVGKILNTYEYGLFGKAGEIRSLPSYEEPTVPKPTPELTTDNVAPVEISLDKIEYKPDNLAVNVHPVFSLEKPTQVTTKWVTTDGKPLKDPITGDKTHEAGQFDGYTFVETTTDDNGNVTHIFKPTPKELTTKWVDENGNELKTPVTAEKTHEAGSINGYTFVRTETDVNGNVTHIFKKSETKTSEPTKVASVKQLTTKWVDENGKELKSSVTGEKTQDAGSIDGYTFVRTDTDTNGNVTHIFKKAETKTETKSTNESKSTPTTGVETISFGLVSGLTALTATLGFSKKKKD